MLGKLNMNPQNLNLSLCFGSQDGDTEIKLSELCSSIY